MGWNRRRRTISKLSSALAAEKTNHRAPLALRRRALRDTLHDGFDLHGGREALEHAQ